MSVNRFDRGAMLLGVGGVLSGLFTFSTSSDNNFVTVGGASLVILVALGAIAIVGGAVGQPLIVLAAGAGYAVAAATIFIGNISAKVFLGAQASTVSLMAGLAIGLIVIGYLGRTYPDGIGPDQ